MRRACSIRWALLFAGSLALNLVLTLVVTLIPTQAMAQSAVCEVVALKGEATSGGKTLVMGDKLAVGADVRTGANGRVRLRFVDGSMLVVSDASQVRIEQFDRSTASAGRAAVMLLDVGLVGQKVTPSANGSWKVRTPTAVTAVRGTEFTVEVDSEQQTAVNVQSGRVDVVPASQMRARSLGPAPRVVLQQIQAGTECNKLGMCTAAHPWRAERVQQVQDRLAGV